MMIDDECYLESLLYNYWSYDEKNDDSYDH